MSRFDDLRRRIENRDAMIGVIGLGYVGLPVAVSFAEAGYKVHGIDLRQEKVDLLEQGRSHLRDVPDERIAPLRESGHLRASVSFDPIRDADAVIISVPTPIAKGAPDLSSVVFAGEELGKVMKPDSIFILESTTYPGTTDELLQPLLEAGGRKVGEDFLLAYSPERIDPGNPVYDFNDIPKVVGGVDEISTEIAALLYEQVVPKVVTVSGPREAELAKLIENTFRHVNIALVNELAIYSNEMGIDIWEAIEAAATKPFGYMPFWPSPGWGGHCIPLDPAYLSWRVRQHRAHEIRFIELAQAINSEMPRYTVDRISLLLNDRGKSVRNAKILGVGVAYKGGTEDTRESAGEKVLATLILRGATVNYHDPLVPSVDIGGKPMESTALTEDALHEQDLVVILVPQAGVDWELIAANAPMVLDCCNALQRRGDNIVRL
ncbi:MAG: nucleotide sugar dehydrogenase [Actinomycetota bacterium]